MDAPDTTGYLEVPEGLSSVGKGYEGSGLSPPMSRVRIVTGLSPKLGRQNNTHGTALPHQVMSQNRGIKLGTQQANALSAVRQCGINVLQITNIRQHADFTPTLRDSGQHGIS